MKKEFEFGDVSITFDHIIRIENENKFDHKKMPIDTKFLKND